MSSLCGGKFRRAEARWLGARHLYYGGRVERVATRTFGVPISHFACLSLRTAVRIHTRTSKMEEDNPFVKAQTVDPEVRAYVYSLVNAVRLGIHY
jgi:hypothetical protein